MEREQRYIVLKLKDMEEASFPLGHIDAFNEICDAVNTTRIRRGAGLLECVVVEQDWPEYETVWRMIEARVDNTPDHLKGWQVADYIIQWRKGSMTADEGMTLIEKHLNDLFLQPGNDYNAGYVAGSRAPVGGDDRRHIICLCPDCVAPKNNISETE